VKTIDEEFLEALTAGIDRERMDAGDTPGWPWTGKELDNAAASTLATCVLRAPFHQRRRVLLGMLAGLVRDGFFSIPTEDDK
jgi:hypothetical protein